jgi:hypothetical protein
MHLLLIAYEFPPIESAHALRWGYLARELARRGHSLDVISTALGLTAGSRFDHVGIEVRRTFPGPFVGVSRWLAQSRGRAGDPAVRLERVDPPSLAERGYRVLRSALDHVLVPDVRSEWLHWGLSAARAAVAARRPDVVIASHEPGVDLAIGHRLACEYDLPLLADLGDPMLAFRKTLAVARQRRDGDGRRNARPPAAPCPPAAQFSRRSRCAGLRS